MMQDMGKASPVRDRSAVHDHKVVRNLRDRTEIVGDKDHCRIMLFLDPDKFFQDLILGDRIDGSCRFIRDQKCRF